MRVPRALAALLILVLIAACGGGQAGDSSGGDDNGSDTESTAPEPGGGNESNDDGGNGGTEPSDDGGNGSGGGAGGGGSSHDLEEIFATLTPPNSTELSKTTAQGVIFAAWDSSDSFDSLRSFYENAIADTGLQIIQTTEAQGGIAWVIAEDDTGNFGGTVSIFPASDGSGTQVSVTVGEGG